MSAYDRFKNRNDVIYNAYEYARILPPDPDDDSKIAEDAYSIGIEIQVREEFDKMAIVIKNYADLIERFVLENKKLQEPRVDPCPYCLCSELLCGFPNNCTSGEE